MVDLEFKPGQLIETKEGRQGTVRYIGKLHIAPGVWLGLELPDSSGKNDGSVKGERYFTCKPGYGIFVREESITKIVRQALSSTVPKANAAHIVPGASAGLKQSSRISPDVARRRQSLMSNGSGSVGGSRLSTKSPSKPPGKPTSTSASSATSTPRAATPSTTTRLAESAHKLRPSISGRPSIGPTTTAVRSTTNTSRPSIGGTSNLRTATTSRTPTSLSRDTAARTRPSQPIQSTSPQNKCLDKTTVESGRDAQPQAARSPTINEETVEDEESKEMPSIEGCIQETEDNQVNEERIDVQAPPANTGPLITKAVPTGRTGNASNVESRIAQQREIEQLKAKVRTLEQKRQEDRTKLKDVEKLQSDKDRFEGIIQALQKKLRANQQELTETKNKYEEAEARANAVPEISGEQESELELATLDKEMAEERAETYQLELDALKAKHEELELEVEILREENEELSSSLSPEEKASAGWLQMQKEIERLRDALLRLRDAAVEKESSLKAELAEVRDDLDESQKTAELYSKTADKLERVEETNKHLMGQLEAMETNDEIVEALELQRERQLKLIEQLRNQIQDLEEHIQITDELESFHTDEEKRLHAQLDDSEALLNESNRRNLEQDRIIEDLEYTLSKFRDVVQGLQSDIDELRRSRDISELQANEMSSKSRAMMDLNARLNNNAAKTQLKVIDTEMDKVRAELAGKHIDILTLFTHDMFDPERKPILTLLGFGRVRSKAGLVGKLLGERLRERSHLTSGEEIFRTFEVMEQMQWLSEACNQFEEYMHSCTVDQFSACGVALVELEPVEQTVTLWIEALKQDELAKSEADHLKRMQNILADLSEKLIADTTQTKATELGAEIAMVENYADSVVGQLTAITRMVEVKLGKPKIADDESMVFDRKMDQLLTKARTIRYLSGKASQQLHYLRKGNLCLSETTWPSFEEAETLAADITKQVRVVGFTVAEELLKLDSGSLISYASIPSTMVSALQGTPESSDKLNDEPFAFISSRLGSLHSLVDILQTKVFDNNEAIEYELLPPPWIIRAKEIKNTKIVSPELQEELARLERRNVELGSRIAEREKIVEEMSMRVEIAEKRSKESKERDNKEKALQEELNALKAERKVNSQTMLDLRNELATARSSVESTRIEIEALRKAADSDTLAKNTTVTSSTNSNGGVDENLVKEFELEAALLQAEIMRLQSAIRYLREENRSLHIPTSEVLIASARNSWLNPSLSKKASRPASATSELEREASAIYTDLINVAKFLRPIRLSTRPKDSTTGTSTMTWQPVSQTAQYRALKVREGLENWESSRADFISRAKIMSVPARNSNARFGTGNNSGIGAMRMPRADGSNLVKGSARNHSGLVQFALKQDGLLEADVQRLHIVES